MAEDKIKSGLQGMSLELERLQARIRSTYVRGMSLAMEAAQHEVLYNDAAEMTETLRMAESALGSALSAANRAKELYDSMEDGSDG